MIPPGRSPLPCFPPVVLAATLATIALICAAQAQTLLIKGSDTMFPVNQAWASVYNQTTDGAQVEVSGGGSRTGIEALIEGRADIAACSRPFTDQEMQRAVIETAGAKPLHFVVALDGLAVYVKDNNPLTELSLSQIRRIFAGDVNNWRFVGGRDVPIAVFSRNTNSGTYGYFREHVLRGGDFLPSAKYMPTTAALSAAVARDIRAIGYGGIAFSEGVRPLKISPDGKEFAVRPSRDTVSSGSYPLSRPLAFYIHPKAWNGDIAAFLKFVYSQRGQTVASAHDYYALPRETLEQQIAALDAATSLLANSAPSSGLP